MKVVFRQIARMWHANVDVLVYHNLHLTAMASDMYGQNNPVSSIEFASKYTYSTRSYGTCQKIGSTSEVFRGNRLN